MKYETKARPITTVEGLDAAQAAGAFLEYSGCMDFPGDPDTYDMPQGAGGWIPAYAGLHRRWLASGEFVCPVVGGWRGLRAFYPARPSLLSRLAFWRAAA